MAIRQISSHWPIIGVGLILLVYHRGHAGQCFSDLILADHAVVQPVGDVLAGDAQRRTVFHESDIVNVRHFGTAHPVFHPAHNVAEDTLCVVVEFTLNRFRRDLVAIVNRQAQQLSERPALLSPQ